ncbi:flagellar hook-basal body complex protein [Alicyclobacillus macrosporangiidus]|uniref:flagellar hook-basal body complex protein n=1 Tax=Alicyclobacillus macrosporangiidus TaxID=392015 RepID=UPI0004950E91|nr:flagellar hook-basal body complex protein [Alicyclobacillus macrosporangiidus]
MLRSMYSAISGMAAFQTKLDVIGNNIANVNTAGFKSSRTDFADTLSQMMAGSSAPVATPNANVYTLGGTNSQQVGLGVKVDGIQTLFTQGAPQSTGNPTDLMLNGSGLFVVSPDNGQHFYYTREGDFSVDSGNNLVLPNGQVAFGFTAATQDATNKVTGLNAYIASSSSDLKQMNLDQAVSDYLAYFKAPLPGSTDPNASVLSNAGVTSANVSTMTLSQSPDVQVGADGSVSANVTVTWGAAPNTQTKDMRLVLGHIAIASVPNPAGLDKAGDSLYQISNNSGQPTYLTPGQNSTGTVQAGYLEMSNVDLTREFTEMIVAQRGFDANSHVIGTANAILQDIVNLKNS